MKPLWHRASSVCIGAVALGATIGIACTGMMPPDDSGNDARDQPSGGGGGRQVQAGNNGGSGEGGGVGVGGEGGHGDQEGGQKGGDDGQEDPDPGTAGAAGGAAAGGTAGTVNTPGGNGGTVPAAHGTGKPPSKFLPELPLFRIGNRRVYNPHHEYPYTLKGSGHTHCEEDHGDQNNFWRCNEQIARHRDLQNGNKHDFVWMTTHNRVTAPPSGISGIIYMFGIEVYSSQDATAGAPHITGLMPDGGGTLKIGQTNPLPPVGSAYRPWTERLTAIASAGGLPTIAHPGRYGWQGQSNPPRPTSGGPAHAANNAPDDLWGIEVVCSSVSADDTQKFIDARLDLGKYVCLSAGNDSHGGADWSTTRGYQVVATKSATPSRSELFAEVKACNFFVCDTDGENTAPLTDPRLKIENDQIVVSMGGNPDRIEFVGRGGQVLHTVNGQGTARFTPPTTQPYIRARAFKGPAKCLSQAVWFID